MRAARMCSRAASIMRSSRSGSGRRRWRILRAETSPRRYFAARFTWKAAHAVTVAGCRVRPRAETRPRVPLSQIKPEAPMHTRFLFPPHLLRCGGLLLSLLAPISFVRAQTNPNPHPADETVRLPEFTVSDTKADAYRAADTMS